MFENGVEEEIRRWIQQATDPQDKALLMILYGMHGSLQENTRAINTIANQFSEHKTAFDEHVEEERSLFSQGRGLYKAMGWSLAIVSTLAAVVVSLGMFIFQAHTKDNDALVQDIKRHDREDQDTINAIRDRLMRIETQIKILDRAIPGVSLGADR